jgi:hypothetical protein
LLIELAAWNSKAALKTEDRLRAAAEILGALRILVSVPLNIKRPQNKA